MDYSKEQITGLLVQYSLFLTEQKIIDERGFPLRSFAEQFLKRVWHNPEHSIANTSGDKPEDEISCKHEDVESMMGTYCFGCQKFIG